MGYPAVHLLQLFARYGVGGLARTLRIVRQTQEIADRAERESHFTGMTDKSQPLKVCQAVEPNTQSPIAPRLRPLKRAAVARVRSGIPMTNREIA